MTLAQPVTVETPVDQDYTTTTMRVLLALFIIVPLLAVIIAIPIAWGGFVGWSDLFLIAFFWALTAGGITVGFHRYFTHGSFKTNRFMKYTLGIAGSLAVQGSLSQWVADHRKHHQFSDDEGDPHSPWRFGTSKRAVAKGLYWAHMGWLFSEEQTSPEKYAPDIANDPDVQRISRLFPLMVLTTLLAPAVLGGLLTWSWMGVLTGFFWGSLIRIALVHHVTWSINSICHVFGTRPFKSRDLSSNVWWLALPSMGESWHSLHHAEPTAARHGVFKGQIDMSATFIRMLEKTGQATDVRWPKHERLVRKLNDPSQESRLRKFHSTDGGSAR
jgi:stearoyl-CoA desaturase (Delta-9 desaturase)